MGDLTKNISRHELKCKCENCEVTIQDHEPIIKVIQDTCDHFSFVFDVAKVTLNITSAARCHEYNRKIGSNDNSQHPRCNAMDIQLIKPDGQQISPKLIAEYINSKYPHSFGVGIYPNFNHIDTREYRARW